MKLYATVPNFATGQFYGPTDASAGDYPANSYLTLPDFQRWQLSRQLDLNQQAGAQFDAIEKQFGIGIPNPYIPIISAIQAQIAALPPEV